jgi:hypothetical protein
MRATAVIPLLVTGCFSLSDSQSRLEGGDELGGACKIEGGDIGAEGVVVRLGSRSVTFHDWIGKDGEPGEYVGFSISLSGTASVGYVVKAGGELHASSDPTWLHPQGPAGGARAPGISNVDLCEQCDDGSCDGGGDEGGGDECQDADGCPGGDGGGGEPVE